MADTSMPPRIGALAGGLLARAPAGAGLREMPVPGQINLRGSPGEVAFARSAATAIGCELPLTPNTVATTGETSVLWMGPDEWLVMTPPGAEGELGAKLNAGLVGQHVSVTDVSGNRTLIRFSAEFARDALAKGCSLDLHPRVFKVGDCAQTLVARAAVVLHRRDETTYDLLPRRSFAEYLWLWLCDASTEYGSN